MVNRHAFALIDVVAATLLLGVALAVTIGLTGRALSAQRSGEELEIAAMLADEQLELILARGPDEYDRRFDTEGLCDEPFDRYAYEIDLDGGSESQPYRAVVTISWNSGASSRSIAVDTLVASRLGDEPDPERKPIQSVERGL